MNRARTVTQELMVSYLKFESTVVPAVQFSFTISIGDTKPTNHLLYSSRSSGWIKVISSFGALAAKMFANDTFLKPSSSRIS